MAQAFGIAAAAAAVVASVFDTECFSFA